MSERKTQRKNKPRPHTSTKLTMWSRVSPVATRLRTILNYSAIINPGSIPVYEYLFNLNSLFDPDRTSTGHQPLGFDQIKVLYNRYRVYRVWYDVSWVPFTNDAVVLIAAPTNEATAIGTIETALETYSTKHSKNGNVYSPIDVSGVISLHTLNGKTPAQYADDDTTQALISASPTEIFVLHVICGSLSGTTVTGYATVNLRFECEFEDPVQLSAS